VKGEMVSTGRMGYLGLRLSDRESRMGCLCQMSGADVNLSKIFWDQFNSIQSFIHFHQIHDMVNRYETKYMA
jgi:hypothetical protein